MQLDLNGGGNNITTDTTGEYQETTGGNADSAKVNISAFTVLADNLAENITTGGGLLTSTAVTSTNASLLSANQNKTSVTFSSIEGIDTNEGSPDGFSASARTVNYKVRGALLMLLGSIGCKWLERRRCCSSCYRFLRSGAQPCNYWLRLQENRNSFSLSDVSLTTSQTIMRLKRS